MLVDLVQVQTRDGVRLDGIYQTAERKSDMPVDALCFIHGTGGNFYNSTLFDAFAERFRQLGCGILRVNTRGHDGLSTAVTAQGGKRQGAAYEFVDDCRHDLAAWLDWLKQKIGPRIGLVGHSLGAVKAIYALAQPDAGAVTCLLALSPPRLSYSWFCSSPEGPAFLKDYQQAEERVAAGQPAALLEVKLPLPFVITAAGFLEKYGPDERYNYLKFVSSVACPVLVTFGATEVTNNMAFRGAPEALEGLATRKQGLKVTVIPGGDHFYTGVRNELIDAVAVWLHTL
jgi:pimeloyl-ACP methyl ester carboxylesterase